MMNKMLRLFIKEDELNLEMELGNFTLQFKNQEIEQKYMKENNEKLKFLYRISSILQILINLGFIVNSSVIYLNLQNVIYRCVFAAWLLICMFLQSCFRKYENVLTNILIYINSIINVLLFASFTQFVNKKQANIDDIISLTMMSSLQQALFVITFFMIQSNYLYQSATLITTFFILMGVFSLFSNYRLWPQYILLFFTCYLLRANEKALRIRFFQIHQSNANLEACKKIYDETVPNSIVIIEQSNEKDNPILLNSLNSQREYFTEENKQNLVYFNKSASKHFETVEEQRIIQQILEMDLDTQTVEKQSNPNIYKMSDKLNQIQCNFKTEQRFSATKKADYQIIDSPIIMQCQRLSRKDQKLHYYDVKAVGCLWDGKQCVMLILNEITDRILRIKHLQEMDTYKDNLLATVSHDLKTPLNGLLIIVNVVKTMLVGKEIINYQEIKEILKNLDDMISNQEILHTMVNDLIDYSQLQHQGLRLNMTQFSLNNCLDKIKTMFRRQIEMKKLQLNITGQENMIEMYSDETRLQQILFNLVNNAIKFTYQGSIGIHVQQAQCLHGIKLIRFQIKDTGIGIPTHIQAKLFKAYSTHNIGNCNKFGVGLGLLISKKMVGLLGPKEFIELVSQEGVGSCFSFDLYINTVYKDHQNQWDIPIMDSVPLKKIPSIDIRNNCTQKKVKTCTNFFSDLSLAELPQMIKKYNILIVDDTIFNIYALQILLNKILPNKVNISDAPNGKEAVRKFSEEQFDVIFMDVNMPIMDGLEATKIIREQEVLKYGKAQTIIFILSAFQTKLDIDNAFQAGANEHLEKPLNIRDLKKILQQYKLM